MDLGQVSDERPFFFGDETSIGLAQALAGTMHAAHDATYLFEMSMHSDTHLLLREVGFPKASIVERMPADGHYETLEARIGEIVAEMRPGAYALSGKAASVQRIGRILKKLGVEPTRIRSKAYWAPGKKGLD
jgi:NADPH-dependent ferric siderophore reductase